MWPPHFASYTFSTAHSIMAALSIAIGIVNSVDAEIWTAHRVSPIWSGAFFLLTGVVGLVSSKKRTPYIIMCFGALCLISLVVAVVNIQLLRFGLVNHYADGVTFRKDTIDLSIILALCDAGIEILICLLCLPVCYVTFKRAEKEVNMKRDGTFSIQVLGDKDIIIHQTSDRAGYRKIQFDLMAASRSIINHVIKPESQELDSE